MNSFGLSRWLLIFALCFPVVDGAQAQRPAAFEKLAPDTLDDLKQIEARVEAVAAQTAPATVSLNLGRGGTGSGVVIGEEGYILTAAHVIGDAGQVIQVYFPDGRVETAVTLGSDQQNDAGLAKLQGEGPWPHVEMAPPGTLTQGDWVVALGHPGGFDEERSVVVRLGRIVRVRPVVGIQSDCSLIGGDSGGPLFDVDGRVVGIHSRIGASERTNIHVPIGEYHTGWDRLASGRQWGQRQSPLLGVMYSPDPQDRGLVVDRVLRRSAASRAGVKRGDLITHLDDQPMLDGRAIHEAMALQVPGDPITLTILRQGGTLQLEVTLGEANE